MKYTYKKTDAFTTAHSAGNPAACIYLKKDEEMTGEAMQKIAKAHEGFVCEMAFCKETEGTEADYDVCYYSSECEVDFCGHGTIACMYSLLKEKESEGHVDELKIRTKKGTLTVYNEISTQDAVYISAPAPEYKKVAVDKKALAQALKIPESEIAQDEPISVINAGLTTLIVPIQSFEQEVEMLPDRSELEGYVNQVGVDIILVYCKETEDARFFMHTRVFAPKFGYLEDPATGSASSAFGYYLLDNEMWQGETMSLEQGNMRGAFNEVCLMTKEQDGKRVVLFGGRAQVRIEGSYNWNE